MSDIAKCPICGEDPEVLVDIFDKHARYPKGYYCCDVECRTLITWNKYAAAMNLAIVRSAYVNTSDVGRLVDVQLASKRVLEVFR